MGMPIHVWKTGGRREGYDLSRYTGETDQHMKRVLLGMTYNPVAGSKILAARLDGRR